MENHQFSLGQNWWLSGDLCLLSIDYFTVNDVGFLIVCFQYEAERYWKTHITPGLIVKAGGVCCFSGYSSSIAAFLLLIARMTAGSNFGLRS